MKKFFFISISTICLALAGCTPPPASESEILAMCKNLTRVRSEVVVPTVKQVTADVDAEFALRKSDLLTYKARDQAGWDRELAEAKKRLEMNPEEKDVAGEPMTVEKLEEIYAAKKERSARDFDRDIARLGQEKDKKLVEQSNLITERQKEFDEQVAECVLNAKTEKISKTLAMCRIAAPDDDTYWNKCKDY